MPTDAATPTEALTDDMIDALRREAIAAGDDLGASLCGSAMRGNANHRLAVCAMINDARAQDDSRPFVRVVP